MFLSQYVCRNVSCELGLIRHCVWPEKRPQTQERYARMTNRANGLGWPQLLATKTANFIRSVLVEASAPHTQKKAFRKYFFKINKMNSNIILFTFLLVIGICVAADLGHARVRSKYFLLFTRLLVKNFFSK